MNTRRTCAECRRAIGKGHKWRLTTRNGMTTLVHRVCANPTGYEPKGQEPQSLFNLKGQK